MRILAYHIGHLGDTIVSIPALKALRRHFGPGTEIVLLHNRGSSRLVTPVDVLGELDLVDGYMTYDSRAGMWGQARALFGTMARIRRGGFHAVAYLAPSQRPRQSVLRDRMFFRGCGIPRLLGFHGLPRAVCRPVDASGRPAPVRQEGLLRLERLREDGVDVDPAVHVAMPLFDVPSRWRAAADVWLTDNRRHRSRNLVAVCPGAKKPANRWPLSRFGDIGRLLLADGRYELVVAGGADDRVAAASLLSYWGDGLNAAGVFPVLGSAALFERCHFLVGLDTGTTHLAAAVGVPCVALFGDQENPGRWDPLGSGHRLLRHAVPCAGCRLIETPCPVEGHPCMTGISTDEAWEAVVNMGRDLAAEREADSLGVGCGTAELNGTLPR